VSFRVRLSVFFFLIVVLPMVAIAVLLVEVSERARDGKADAQLATGLTTALSVYEDDVARAKAQASRLVRSGDLGEALVGGDAARARQFARDAARRPEVEFVRVELPGGESIEEGSRQAIAVADVAVEGADGNARVSLSVTGPTEYVEEVRDRTGLDVAVLAGDRMLASTLSLDDAAALPEGGDSVELSAADDELRAAAVDLANPSGGRVVTLTPLESEGFFGSSPRVAAALGAFLLIALVAVWFLVRSLQGQVATMLYAARRIGEGDFTQKVPVVGRDEMAGLAAEFNKMSDRLAEQVDQLRRQRIELDRSIRRLGEAFAKGLDRDAVLRIVLETALTACEAQYGRIALADGTVVELPEIADGAARQAALGAESRARADRVQVEASDESGLHALAAPLRPLGGGDVVGTMTVARGPQPFGQHERDVFLYLIGQASASLENISTHERVTEQATTDELTGLANKRAFSEVLEREVARAERFGHELSLIMLDVDDFKLVNDTHGHLQGDEVLRAIGRILADEPREIDEPARYGGEEFVIALPETGLEGALELAERIRARIEIEAIPMLGADEVMYVSASFGVATLPTSARDEQELIAAADEALYAAKAAGKNRVAAAPPLEPGEDGAPRAKGQAGARRR
jgi:diguanylate cyclase (GGDEF)-like protein